MHFRLINPIPSSNPFSYPYILPSIRLFIHSTIYLLGQDDKPPTHFEPLNLRFLLFQPQFPVLTKFVGNNKAKRNFEVKVSLEKPRKSCQDVIRQLNKNNKYISSHYEQSTLNRSLQFFAPLTFNLCHPIYSPLTLLR